MGGWGEEWHQQRLADQSPTPLFPDGALYLLFKTLYKVGGIGTLYIGLL